MRQGLADKRQGLTLKNHDLIHKRQALIFTLG